MQLTGKQIVEKGIVTNVCPEGVQQQGVDARVLNINKVDGFGLIPTTGKTTIPHYTKIEPADGVYVLNPGYYEVTFMEGCNLDDHHVLNFISRSSLVRIGAYLCAGQFDAGFKTNHMGCFMNVTNPTGVHIGVGARIGQVYVRETYTVAMDDLYDGQWQGDKQRATQN